MPTPEVPTSTKRDATNIMPPPEVPAKLFGLSEYPPPLPNRGITHPWPPLIADPPKTVPDAAELPFDHRLRHRHHPNSLRGHLNRWS